MPAGFCVGRPNAAVAVVVLRDRTEDVVAPSVILVVVVAALNILLLSSVRRKVKPRPVRRIGLVGGVNNPTNPSPSVRPSSRSRNCHVTRFFSLLTMGYYI